VTELECLSDTRGCSGVDGSSHCIAGEHGAVACVEFLLRRCKGDGCSFEFGEHPAVLRALGRRRVQRVQLSREPRE
jgi:hypothetical protein